MYLLDPDALFSYGKLNIVMTYIPTGENIYSPCVAKCSVQNLDDNLGLHLLWNASNMKWNTCVGLILFVVKQSTEGVCMGISFTLLPPYILCVLFRKRPLPTSQQKKFYKKKKGKNASLSLFLIIIVSSTFWGRVQSTRYMVVRCYLVQI